MNLLKVSALIAALTSLLLLLAGLFKPAVMLWWDDHQNRRKVLKLYGGISLLSGVLYWLLFLLLP